MTTCKDALHAWQQKNGTPLGEAEEVLISFQIPPIAKMDSSLGVLVNCKKLSLSSNQIQKIAGLQGLKNLKILSLARNIIKHLAGIEVLGPTLEQLWMSYNSLTSLNGINQMKALKVFYIGYNNIHHWKEVARLAECPNLNEFLFVGNPLIENMAEAEWRADIMKILPRLKMLDGDPTVTIPK